MKISTALLGAARKPQNPNKVPYKEVVPLKLNSQLHSSGAGDQPNICLEEMALVLGCLKKSNYKEELCNNELMRFQKCFLTHERVKNAQKKERAIQSKKEKNGVFVSPINRLLLRFPNL
ncbi:hypothetical protein RUM44_008669 [Polyplax serrata]|uniref:CHCH domain-containing protein n=1 Tax=Polyplax serrata TaxID=468196 RepID=A0ABR1B8X8_POLSC